jgi:hypothetical protein
MPVKTFLNCTMPALVNMSVGSLRGTSELDGTTLCPFLAKNWRKFDRMSLTPLMHQNRLKLKVLEGVLEHRRQKRQWEEDRRLEYARSLYGG